MSTTVIDSLLVRLGFLPDPSGARQFESVLGGLQGKVAGFLGFLGSFATIGSFVETASQFEQFEVQLTTIQGSAEKAKESLEWISTFAAKTPYEVAQVTEAFVKLQSYGLNPQANGLLESIGNMASGMGKSIDQAVEAIADAVNGENERLKEFGIKGSKSKSGFEYTYNINGQEFKKQTSENAQEIQKALQEIMDERFKGGMEAMSKTWKGTLSNLSDTWQMFQLSVMDAGVFEAMKASLNEFMIGVVGNKDEIKAFAKATGENILYVLNRLGQLGDIVKDWADNMGLTARSGQIFAVVLGLIASNLTGLAAVAAASGMIALFRGFMMLLSPIGLLGGALIGLFLIFDDLQSFAEGGDSFLIPFLQQSPAVVAALGLVATALSVVAAKWIYLKLQWLTSLAGMVAVTIAQAWTMASAWIAANVAMIMASLPLVFSIIGIIAAIALVVAGIYWLYSNWDTVWNGLGEIVANIVGMVTEQWNGFVATIEGGWQKVEQAWNKAKGFVGLGDDSTVNVNGSPVTSFVPNANTVGAAQGNTSVSQTNTTTINVPTASDAVMVARETANNQSKNAMRYATVGGVSQ